MKLGNASIASLERLEKKDQEYREAKVKLEAELRVQLKDRLKGLEWERALAARDADNTIVRESGRSNIAAISRALHSQDHATAKGILALTEEVKHTVASSHPDEKLISASVDSEGNPVYSFTMNSGETATFKIVRGEYVGVSPTVADQLDDENAIERIAEWEERRK